MDQDEFPDNGTPGFERGPDEKRRSRRSHHHQRTQAKRHWLVSPLWITICLEALVIIGVIFWATALEVDYAAGLERERELEKKLADTQGELEGLKYDLNQKALAEEEGCRTKIVALKLDQFLDINKEYVKRAFFVLSGKKDKRVLEYKFVLKNESLVNVVPKFDIVFFNASGNEIGTARFGYNDEGVATEKALEKGEVRSVDGTFDVSGIALPDALMIRTLND